MFQSLDKTKALNPDNQASFWENLGKNVVSLGLRLALVLGSLGAAGGAMAETTNKTQDLGSKAPAKTEIKEVATIKKEAQKAEISTPKIPSKPTNIQQNKIETPQIKPLNRPNLVQTKTQVKIDNTQMQPQAKTVSELRQIPTNLRNFYDQTNAKATEINNRRKLEDLKKAGNTTKESSIQNTLTPIKEIKSNTLTNRDLLKRPVGNSTLSDGSTTSVTIDTQGKLSPSFSSIQHGKTERGLNDRGVLEFRSTDSTFHTSEIILQESFTLKYSEEIKIYNFSVALNIILASLKDGKPEFKTLLGGQYIYRDGINKTGTIERNSVSMSKVSPETVARILESNSSDINKESTLFLKIDGAGTESLSSSNPNYGTNSTQQRIFVSGISERNLQTNRTEASVSDSSVNTVLFSDQTQNQLLNNAIINVLAQGLPKLSNDLPGNGTPNLNVNPILIRTSNEMYRGVIPQANVFHTSISTSNHPTIGQLLPVINSIAYGIGYSQVYTTDISSKSRIFDIQERSPFLNLNIDKSNANLKFNINQQDQGNSAIFNNSNIAGIGTDLIYDVGLNIDTQKATRENEINIRKQYRTIPELYFTAQTKTEQDLLRGVIGTTFDTRNGFNPFAKLIASHTGLGGEFANFALQYFVRPNESQQTTISVNLGKDFTSGDVVITPFTSANISLAGALENSHPNTAAIGLNLKSNVFGISLRQLFNLGTEFTSGTAISLRVKLSDNFSIWGSYSNLNTGSDTSVGSSLKLGQNNTVTLKLNNVYQTGLPSSTNASVLWQYKY